MFEGIDCLLALGIKNEFSVFAEQASMRTYYLRTVLNKLAEIEGPNKRAAFFIQCEIRDA